MSPFDTFIISRGEAQRILCEGLGREVRVKSLQRLRGGMICSVLLAEIDGEPGSIVLKIAKGKPPEDFEWQFKILEFLSNNIGFPVPRPYFFRIAKEDNFPSILAMEKLPGSNLSEFNLSVLQHQELDGQIALAVAQLHSHTRETFGNVFADPGKNKWVDIFRAKVENTLPVCEQRLGRETFKRVNQILGRLDVIFADRTGPASLVHGDLWVTNIIIDICNGKVKLSGFVDPSTIYADPEYELAYLEVFRTVGSEFFRVYRQYHKIAAGYEELRRSVYHLHTMLVHVKVFGDVSYVRRTQEITKYVVRQLEIR